MNFFKVILVGLLLAWPTVGASQGFIGGLIEGVCGGCGAGRALDDFHRDALGNVLDIPVRVVQESVVEVAGPALAEAIRHSRNDARKAGTQPIPRSIYQKMLSIYPKEMLDKVEYRVGKGHELSVQSNSFRFGDAAAVALIDTVVFQSDYHAQYNDVLWAHELKHIEQYNLWSLTGFGKRYVRSSRQVEQEAYDAANAYAKNKSPNATPPIWFRVDGGLKHISGNGRQLWGVNNLDDIYRWNGDGWDKISGGLKQISVAQDGTVWGVNRNDQIWRWNGRSWDNIDGGLKFISVGSSTNIWGVNSLDDIYRWNGDGWDKISGGLKQISVAQDGTVWGVNRNDQIYVHR